MIRIKSALSKMWPAEYRRSVSVLYYLLKIESFQSNIGLIIDIVGSYSDRMGDTGSVGYILYADDDSEDQEIFRELLSESLPHIQLITKDSGEDLLQFLNEVSNESNWPRLVILDLNMPGWDGIQTLTLIKQNERYRHLPVIIFSTADNEKERDRAFSAGAVAFVRKPSRYNELKTIIESFAGYF